VSLGGATTWTAIMRANRHLYQNRCLIVGTLSRLRTSSWIARDIRTVRLGAGTLLLLLLMSKSALAFDLDGAAWTKIARDEGIDPIP